MFLKINENFGSDLYNSTGKSLFYIVFIIIIISLGVSLIRDLVTDKKNKILSIICNVLMCALVLFIANNPTLLLSIGEWTFNFMFDILKSLEA